MGTINGQGVYEYDDDEPFAPLSDYQNLQAAALTAALAAVRAQIAAITSLVDSSWVPITTFGTGWTATVGHQPRLRKIGARVDIVGAVTAGTGAAYADILTIPAGFRLAGAYANYFVGASVSSQAQVHELFIDSTSHKIAVPSTYRVGAITSGGVLPLHGTWYTN